MKKIKRGSFTVEAALLMPLIFLILMGLLYQQGMADCGCL